PRAGFAVSRKVERCIPTKIARCGGSSPTCRRECVLKWRIRDPASPTPDQETRCEQHIFRGRLCRTDIARRHKRCGGETRKPRRKVRLRCEGVRQKREG